MENRISKVNISAAGGTASQSAKTCKVTIPNAWLEQLGVTSEEREVVLSFDGESITLRKHLTGRTFAEMKAAVGHQVKKISFFDKQTLCSVIYADFTDQTLTVENLVKNPVKTAFGNRKCQAGRICKPSWRNAAYPNRETAYRTIYGNCGWMHMIPWQSSKKTEGRMAEDQQWLQIEEVGL